MWWPHSVLFNFKNIRLIFCSRWHFWVNILFAWIGLLLLLRLIKLPDFHESIQDIILAWKEAGFEPISFRFWGATSPSIWKIFLSYAIDAFEEVLRQTTDVVKLTQNTPQKKRAKIWSLCSNIRHHQDFLSFYVVKNVATFAVIIVVVVAVVVAAM